MSSLLLLLAGPMQAWGTSSRFAVRETQGEPSRSGIIGMLAAAQGRRRTEALEDLLQLRFAVRADQPGSLLRDFHTAHTMDGTRSMPLSNRYYLQDAVFVAAVEGDEDLLDGLNEAVRKPRFPLYLGRRSCVPMRPVALGIRQEPLRESLTMEPWHAAPWFKARCRQSGFRAEVNMDAGFAQSGSNTRTVRDDPVSFDPRLRQYTWRNVERFYVEMLAAETSTHDPFAALEAF